MDNQQTTSGSGLPPGYSQSDIVPANSGGNGPNGPSGLPPGYSQSDIVAIPQSNTSNLSNPAQTDTDQPKPQSALTMNDDDNLGTKAVKTVGGVLSGIGEGVFGTVAGAADLVHAPQQARQLLHTLAGDNEQQSTAENIGQGGETIAEFIMGDEALKAIPYVKRLETALKATQVIQGSPKLAQAMQVGAKVLKLAALHGAEAGTVQGAQTLVRSGGDVEQAAKEGAGTALGAGVLGVPLEAGGELLQKAGDIAGRVKNLANVAKGAKGTEEIAEELSNRLKSAEVKRGTDFEDGINKIKSDLAGQTIERQDSPVMIKAKELLADPIPEDDPTTKLAKNISGDKLDASTKALLEDAALGGKPEKTAVEAASNKGFLGLAEEGPKKDVTPVNITPHAPYDIDNLIQIRQAVRKAAADYDYRDPNAYALRQINNSIDDTIEQLAAKSGKPQALTDYQQLRGNYKTQLHAFDNPVMRNLRDGKVNDAAKAFVGTINPNSTLPSAGKTNFNIDTLKDAIGPDGVKAFGKDVFKNMLLDSVEGDKINPGKFVDSWKRIDNYTKQNLFDVSNAKNGLQQLASDAQAGAKLQTLTKAGILTGVTSGAIAPPIAALHAGMGLGTMLGLVVAEGGGIAAGRNLLNYIADHPKTWSAYESAGKMASKSTGKIPKVIAASGNDILNPNKNKQDVYSGAQQALGGK